MNIATESLLAVTGLFPKRVTPEDRVRALDVPGRLTRRLKRWLTAPKAAFVYVPQPDMVKKLQQLTESLPEGLLGEWGTEDPQGSAAYQKALEDARAYMLSVWPRVSIDTFAGVEQLPPSGDAAFTAWDILRVLEDPEHLMDDMDQQCLTAPQAQAFRTVYPALYDHCGQEFDRLKLQTPKGWEATPEQTRQVRILKGMPVVNPLPPLPPPAAPPAKFKLEPDKNATQGQLAEKPKTGDEK